jgi:hypothetical protein
MGTVYYIELRAEIKEIKCCVIDFRPNRKGYLATNSIAGKKA